MGDLGVDTEVTGGDGVYGASLSREWEIWGPMGGYLASFALRAAGLHSQLPRPASLVGHFLGVADFETPIEVECTTLRAAKTAHSVRATIKQGDRALFEALVWATVGELQGLEHHFAPMPDVEHWSALPTIQERVAAAGESYTAFFPFWENLAQRPPQWIDNWIERKSGENDPVWQQWLKFQPTASFADPWIDACRLLILVDLGSWPATQATHNTPDLMAPSIDLACEFHRIRPDAEWLLAQGTSPSSAEGLVASHQAVWDEHGTLLASGISQLLCRPTRRQ